MVIKVCNGNSSSDVIHEPVECSCDVGLGEWPLDAAVEAVSKEVLCAWGRLGVGAKVVEPNVLYGLDVLCKGHVGNSELFVSPEWEATIGDIAVLWYAGVEGVLVGGGDEVVCCESCVVGRF